ncbi:MAG: aminotransferase class I/II-fold pyridoxal phosphate-dependent enzyme [Anaerolineales bacterium]|nr:aminotransferase class I/II-fold pyridoxal phosphate-dependent enzyme [Anaerolineales bacterium]MCX7608169.1 aminotransferase class I/II-fold pyridoxal phosphate-dependent enzyme [Anaerolineales bacterium]MDW8226509.1 aminotransferase class I/II-fold pyridoxal phosphate-dependent enzyme [Anaerolineales bacterium]
MNLNQQLDLIRQSATVLLNDRIVAARAAGKRVIPLHVGDPDFPTPPSVLEAAFRALRAGLTHYGPSRGDPELRQAAALKLSRDNGLDYDPQSEILVTHGGIHAYYLALQTLLNPGDDVLIPDPTWATHVNMALMLRANVIRVPAPVENGFLPTFEDWERALTPRSRVIVINYPSNPTGMYPSRAYMQTLQDFAAAHKLWVVSDEVYENLYYEEKPISAAALNGAKERTLLVHSLSKTYAMTGWRVGYLAAPARVIDQAIKVSQNSITCVAPFIQKAAAFALTDPDVQQAAAAMRIAYARRRDLVMCIASEIGSTKVIARPSPGAFYFFLDIRPLRISSLEFCERILEEAGVGVVPGSAFGRLGEGFVRMTIAASDAEVETGFRALLTWAEQQKTSGGSV